MKKLTEKQISKALINYHQEGYYSCEQMKVKNNIEDFRPDLTLYQINPSRIGRKVIMIEIKTDKQDYLNDEKYIKYMEFCTHFAFAYPEGLVPIKKHIDKKTDTGLYLIKEIGNKLSVIESITPCRTMARIDYLDSLEGMVRSNMNK